MGIYPRLDPSLEQQLATFAPSVERGCRYWPCVVTLKDGTILERVIVTSASPEWLPGRRDELDIREVVSVRESPKRLPASLASKLYEAGESGMGYFAFTVVLRDGRRLPFVTGSVVDFPALPDDVSCSDVADVLRGTGETFRERPPIASESSARFLWCLFDPESPE